jgi:hypothetical protein
MVANGVTYFYVVSAVNTSLESVNSFEVAATPRAPTFTWSAPVKISTADATLGLPGTNVSAACFGATSTSITVTLSNGKNIVFKGDGTTATCTGQSTFTGANTNNTGNATFNKVLNSAEYDSGPHIITLKGLAVGQLYSVQLFALDDRNPATVGFRRFNYQDPNDATDISQTFTMAADVYMVGCCFGERAPAQTICLAPERDVHGGRRLAARAVNGVLLSRYRQPGGPACNSTGTTGSDVPAPPWHGAEGR